METEHQLQVLTEIGLDFGQGYLFSAPLPLSSLMARLPRLTDRHHAAVTEIV